MKVKLSEIINAIEMMNEYSECFLDMETGEIEWIDDMTMTQKKKTKSATVWMSTGFTGFRHLMIYMNTI